MSVQNICEINAARTTSAEDATGSSGHLFSLTLKNLSRIQQQLQKYEVIVTPINALGKGDFSRRVVRLQRSPRNVRWDSGTPSPTHA